MISSNYSNFTKFGIRNEAERYTWTMWLIFILSCSLLGDTIILVSSIKYNAFRIHDWIVAFIQHIAVCDLLISIFTIFPTIVSLLANGWVFGEPFCHFTATLTVYGVPTSSLLICALTSSKLWLLKNPLRARTLPKSKAHKLCAGIWVLALTVPALYLTVDMRDVYWGYNIYSCYYAHSSTKWKILEPLNHGIFGGLPTVIVIITSILLVHHLLKARKVATRSRGQIRWQGIATVVAVACIYTFAVLPLTVYWIAETYLEKSPDNLKTLSSRTAKSFFYFNVASNFFIYFFTVQSFRMFVRFLRAEVTLLLWSCYPSCRSMLFYISFTEQCSVHPT